MSSIVCTLFEGHYHYGVAGLVNSLYQNGYSGVVYAGYKGELPFWTRGCIETKFLQFLAFEKQITRDLKILFVRLETDSHLTNYKPDFLLSVYAYLQADLTAIFYFDPDIVLSAPWSFMTGWVDCGIAVSEDVNSPLQEFHPKRCYWRKYYAQRQVMLTFKNTIYVNGGFAGIRKEDIAFVELWKKVQELMSPAIGGLSKSIFNIADADRVHIGNEYAPFSRTDQDALNITIEAYDKQISYGGKEVMGITHGLAVIPHAIGKTKPWKLKPLSNFLKGRKPALTDKLFWKNYSYKPIRCFSSFKVSYMNNAIKITSFLSRFYGRDTLH